MDTEFLVASPSCDVPPPFILSRRDSAFLTHVHASPAQHGRVLEARNRTGAPLHLVIWATRMLLLLTPEC